MNDWQYYEDKEQNVEFRYKIGRIDFRLIYTENPTNYQQVVANAELRHQGGTWVPVPSDMMNKVPQIIKEKLHA